MIVFSNAKINLALAVAEKRPDGYHNLTSIFIPVPFYDVIEVVPSSNATDSIIQSGKAIEGPISSNLVYKALILIRQNFSIPPLHIYLHKNIPQGAGLGGGSSNASSMLKLLNQLFKLQISETTLSDMALELGSDCPFFIYNKPALVTGRGENIKPIDVNLKGYYFVIIYPAIHISTSEAFQRVSPSGRGREFDKISYTNPDAWRNFLYNDFESGVFEIHPEIKILKHFLYESGAVFSSMTGSGSSVFALFKEKPDVKIPPHYFSFIGYFP